MPNNFLNQYAVSDLELLLIKYLHNLHLSKGYFIHFLELIKLILSTFWLSIPKMLLSVCPSVCLKVVFVRPSTLLHNLVCLFLRNSRAYRNMVCSLHSVASFHFFRNGEAITFLYELTEHSIPRELEYCWIFFLF